MASATCNVKECQYKHFRKDKCTAFYLHIVKDKDGRPICTTFKERVRGQKGETDVRRYSTK